MLCYDVISLTVIWLFNL